MSALPVALALAWYCAANLAACLVVALVSGRWIAAEDHPSRRARRLLGLRLLPAAASGLGVLFLFAPAYWWLEPAGVPETAGRVVLVLAAGGAALWLAAVLRAGQSLRSTRQQEAAWMARAQVLATSTGAPTYRVRDPFPNVSLIGFWRPRIFVAEEVASVLTGAELAVALAHETGHLRARDNLKRAVLRACPDPMAFLPAGRRLEEEWARAAEAAADLEASAGDPARAADLASAIVKVARLGPRAASGHVFASALGDGEDVGRRVRALLDPVVPAPRRRDPLTVLFLVAAAALAYLPLLHLVHRLTEAAILLR